MHLLWWDEKENGLFRNKFCMMGLPCDNSPITLWESCAKSINFLETLPVASITGEVSH